MDLILWRHAQAHEATHGMDDLDRCLTTQGEKQAARMGQWLDRQLPSTARILVSPAQRTLQTARALGRKFKVCEDLSPDQSAQALLSRANWPLGKGTVVVVGHQPTLGQALSQLLDLKEADFAFKKGAVWWLRHRQQEGKNATVVITVQSPDFV